MTSGDITGTLLATIGIDKDTCGRLLIVRVEDDCVLDVVLGAVIDGS